MKKVRLMDFSLCGVLAALVFCGTFFLKVPVPFGYLHLGDAFVCLAGAVLPTPYAFFAAAIGGGLSDLLGGYPMYLPATFLLKGLMTLLYTNRGGRILCRRNLWATVLAAAITVVGCGVTGGILLALAGGGLFTAAPWLAAVATVPGNGLQALAGAVLFLLAGAGLDSMGFSARLTEWRSGR